MVAFDTRFWVGSPSASLKTIEPGRPGLVTPNYSARHCPRQPVRTARYRRYNKSTTRERPKVQNNAKPMLHNTFQRASRLGTYWFVRCVPRNVVFCIGFVVVVSLAARKLHVLAFSVPCSPYRLSGAVPNITELFPNCPRSVFRLRRKHCGPF